MNFEGYVEKKDLRGLKEIVITLTPKQKDSALLLASSTGFKQGVELLIEFKANIDATDAYQQTSLHLSIDNGFPEIALWLIKNGASLTKTDCTGATALHHSVANAQLDVTNEIIRVHYERHSAFTRWSSMLNIFKHLRNLKNILHPFKAWAGVQNKACHEYINQKDKMGKNAFVYSLSLDTPNAREIQLNLMLNGAVPEERLSLIESAALLGLQMYLGGKIVELGLGAAFAGLGYGINKLLPPPPKPPIDPPWDGGGIQLLSHRVAERTVSRTNNSLTMGLPTPAFKGDIPMSRSQILRRFGHRNGDLNDPVLPKF